MVEPFCFVCRVCPIGCGRGQLPSDRRRDSSGPGVVGDSGQGGGRGCEDRPPEAT